MIWIISEITIGLILLLFLFVPKNKTNETFEISSSTYGISLFFCNYSEPRLKHDITVAGKSSRQ